MIRTVCCVCGQPVRMDDDAVSIDTRDLRDDLSPWAHLGCQDAYYQRLRDGWTLEALAPAVQQDAWEAAAKAVADLRSGLYRSLDDSLAYRTRDNTRHFAAVARRLAEEMAQ